MSTKPTEEDLKRDLGAYLSECRRFAAQTAFNHAAAAGDLALTPSGTGYPEFLADAPVVAESACRRALFAEAILSAPLVALFGDGRQPTENERHLLNLLSWREHENARLKAELQHLRDAHQ